jgi:carbon-monoxide dehydrogenase medium subunit
MKLRLAAPSALIDIGGIGELRSISANGGGLSVGSMATYYEISQSSAVQSAAPALAEAAGQVADVQVRNRGTIGGSLAHSDPAGDLPAVFLALGGTIVAKTRRASREIPADRFFVDLLTTALRPTEIITEIRFQPAGARSGSAYTRFANKASHYAVAGVAAQVALSSDGTVADARGCRDGRRFKGHEGKAHRAHPQRQRTDGRGDPQSLGPRRRGAGRRCHGRHPCFR